MSILRDKDWLAIIVHYKIFTNNSDVVKELFEKPVKLYLAYFTLMDYWMYFRYSHVHNIPFNYMALFGIVVMPFYIATQYKIGRSRLVRAMQNKTAQLTRTHNDGQWERLFADVKEIKEEIK